MATARLIPSTYYLSNSSYLSVSSASNMYENTDSDTYATVTNSRTSTTSYYIYLRGFNFDSIPSGAIVNSFSIKLKARESGVSTSSSYVPYLADGTTTINGSCTAITTTAEVKTFTGVSADWETIKGYGSDFGIRINCRRSSRNTTGYMYIYGAEIEVDYEMPDPAVVTSTLQGNGTISPNGAYNTYEDTEYTLTITPDDTSEEVTASKNGVDITNDLVPHYAGTGLSLSKSPESYTTELSANGANFYTSSSSTGTYFNYAVGHTAESPGYTSASATYVKDNSSNTATGWAIYSFDFSDLPANAVIESVEVKCYGFTESTTHNSTHKANIKLYSGNTQKGTEQYFTSTSNSIITISDPGSWTREELQDAQLHFEVAYYGGGIFGVTWTVNYSVPSGDPDYYTYTYTVDGDATIAVVIGSGEQLYLKVNGAWIPVTKVYRKVNGSWVEQTDLSSVFSAGGNYVGMS